MSDPQRKRAREDSSEPEISVDVALRAELGRDEPELALTGEHFAKYVLVGEIAQGGMGELFLAVQDGLEGFRKMVVVKRVLRHLTANADFMQMFIDEARLTA